MMRLVVNGCMGRMGQTLTRLIQENHETELIAGLEYTGHEDVGKPLGKDVYVFDQPREILDNVDGILDFTTPESTINLARMSAERGLVHIIGTTGFTEEQNKEIKDTTDRAIIVKSGNMSLGINLLAELVKKATKTLDSKWDIEIIEMHHRHKLDSPSGTALLLGEAAANGRNINLEDNAIKAREGISQERQENQIGFASLRGGNVIGNHEVIIAGEAEYITLGHHAQSRDIFAQGAITAALWAQKQTAGLYSMTDVLGLV